MKAVCLLSGGIDSLTAMVQAQEDGYEVILVSAKYGQKHGVEQMYAHKIAQFYDAEITFVDMPDIFHGRSALMGDIPMPEVAYEELAKLSGPSPTVVPFRNAHLISVATTLAITKKAEAVYIGVHAEDARNWAYPDCSPEFIGAMMNAVHVGSYHEVRLVAPLQYMTKAQVVATAIALRAPLRLTWSCYNPIVDEVPFEVVACGKCPTCVSRIQAFLACGHIDPMKYSFAINTNWSGCIYVEQ